ncbi:MAG: hemerythrin family protein [Rhodocyclaceae bacterium]|nr:hemerythrin family protein [Rhodocyclaceae bacterium]
MQTIQWSAAYSVGDDEIDRQHRRLIDVINRLGQLLSGGHDADGATAQEIFDLLADYVTSHFAYEEQRMVDAGYPLDKVEAHRGEHRRILKSLQAFEVKLEEGNGETLRELLPFLYGDWLTHHICAVDSDYADCLAAERSGV